MRILLTIFLLTFAHLSYARVGMGETTFKTPYGHEISDCDPYKETPVLIGYENKIKSLKEWYFYKGHIVGKGQSYYFIFNEYKDYLQYFESETEWQSAIKQQSLSPFYIRWLDITDSIDNLFLIILFASPILIIFLIVVIWTVVDYRLWRNKKALKIAVYVFLSLTFLIVYRLNVQSY